MLQALFELLGVAAAVLIERSSYRGLVRTFGGPVYKRSLQDRRGDPTYKKNLQRLIERNRQFEDARNEPHS